MVTVDLGLYNEGVTMDELADHIVLDRVYLHADFDEYEARRGIGLNCKSGAVVNSYIQGFKSTNGDAQVRPHSAVEPVPKKQYSLYMHRASAVGSVPVLI